MSHKKAAGSAENLKDSKAKYRGLKLSGGQIAKAGNVILKQKGNQYIPGDNVYQGKDFTLHAAVDGVVSFRRKNVLRFDGRKYPRTVVSVQSA
ncbi:50S ribosomal protein L27 [Patescibacteria group bacterium]|jgi:large subunit ribosomal protein L27|nr:50S ribosomal protein L27 [Patescibacteria group bacterium]